MKRRKSKRKVAIPVASMGDIAFLLIIFFMVCSNFIKESSVKLEPPRAQDIDTLQEPKVLVAIDEQGQIYLQGVKMPDFNALEYGVMALIDGRVTTEGRTVLFRCDRNIPKEVFEPAIDAISSAGGIIAAVGEKSE